MKRKSAVSGAMIVAAGVTASTEPVAAATEPTDTQPVITSGGLSFDAVTLDDDVLRLGGLTDEATAPGAHGSSGAFRTEGEEYYLAQTIYAGSGGGSAIRMPVKPRQIQIPGTRRIVVINPRNSQSVSILHNPETDAYYDAKTGEEVAAPDWMRSQVEE